MKVPEGCDWADANNIYKAEDIVAFTDGSKTNSGAGARIYSAYPPLKLTFPLVPAPTVYKAEIFAILKCSEALKEKKIVNKTIHICTNSQASFKALASFCFTSKITIECLKQINDLAQNNETFLTWVPGHHGIEGNDKADELARKGSETQFVGSEPAIGQAFMS